MKFGHVLRASLRLLGIYACFFGAKLGFLPKL
jgi:hypothetical protein